jgi:hypothetical protein
MILRTDSTNNMQWSGRGQDATTNTNSNALAFKKQELPDRLCMQKTVASQAKTHRVKQAGIIRVFGDGIPRGIRVKKLIQVAKMSPF